MTTRTTPVIPAELVELLDGSVLLDHAGTAWQRKYGRWTSTTAHGLPLEWVLRDFGPVTVLHRVEAEHRAPDPSQPIDVTGCLVAHTVRARTEWLYAHEPLFRARMEAARGVVRHNQPWGRSEKWAAAVALTLAHDGDEAARENASLRAALGDALAGAGPVL